MKINLFSIIFVLCVTLSVAGDVNAKALSSKAAHNGTIVGSVVDCENNPMPDALIYLRGISFMARSDGAGRFIILDVPAGSYELVINEPSTGIVNIGILAKETTDIGAARFCPAIICFDHDGDGFAGGHCEPRPEGYQPDEQPFGEYFAPPTDCDDGDPESSPDADEICDDGRDNDCDGIPDDECFPVCNDDDGDTWASPPMPPDGSNCHTQSYETYELLQAEAWGEPLRQFDCDDGNPDINPGAVEDASCNGIDENCNGPFDDCPQP